MSNGKKTIKTQEKGYIPRALALDILDDVVCRNASPDDRLELYLKKKKLSRFTKRGYRSM